MFLVISGFNKVLSLKCPNKYRPLLVKTVTMLILWVYISL